MVPQVRVYILDRTTKAQVSCLEAELTNGFVYFRKRFSAVANEI